VTTTVTQNADEASTSTQKLTIPFPTLSPNLASLNLQNSGTAVGQATAYSPLLPTPLTGKVYFTGASSFSPTLTIRFPAPNAITLVGAVSLQQSTVTFSGIPDVPQTKLVVALFGGKQALESSNCTQPTGTLVGSFTGQNGAVVTDRVPVTVQGCPKAAGTPSASHGSLSVSANGKPVLGFRLASGSNAPGLKTLKLALPHGLSFNPAGLRRGLSVHGVKAGAILRGGKLIVTLKRAVSAVSIKVTAPLLVANKPLRGRHTLHLTVTDAAGTSTPVSVSISTR
jgi:hypothetical protein